MLITGAEIRNDGEVYESSNLPSNTFMLKKRSCFTSNGRLSSCLPISDCYEKMRSPQRNQLEMWAILTSDACQYTGEDGNQVITIFMFLDSNQMPSPISG